METQRLVLRQLTLDDTDNLLGIFSDPIAMAHYPSKKSRQETQGWIHWCMRGYEQHGHALWAVELKTSGEFLGQCGLIMQQVEGVAETEIGYLFLRKHWGNGYATEAAIASRDYAFNVLGRDRVISLIDPGNLPSRRVAERVGMQLERQIWKWEKDVLIYAMEKQPAG